MDTPMKEGSLEAPTRHPLAWRDLDFLDADKLDAETRRVFDICHGCRRCFNLCDSFPRLFDLIDESDTGELDSVDSAGFDAVVDACTLCDMCFMTKCPYVPPHEFNLDFPHLMLRHRAVRREKGGVGIIERELAKTDRNGRLFRWVAPFANWATATGNWLVRPILELVAGIHRKAALPRFHRRTMEARADSAAPMISRATVPATGGRKAVLYATCFANYNDPEIGTAAQAVLERNGVETAVLHPACCGMPQLEQGDMATVAARAEQVAGELGTWIDNGWDIVTLVPSCGLMLKFEWPLVVPESSAVKRLSEATRDICEYIVDISGKEGLAKGLAPLNGGVAIHLACHARAQNMGAKAAEMMRLVPDCEVEVIERCSGHGGAWGVRKENFEIALKTGRPTARQAAESQKRYVASECPLASVHIGQGMEELGGDGAVPTVVAHPILLLARAYGVTDDAAH